MTHRKPTHSENTRSEYTRSGNTHSEHTRSGLMLLLIAAALTACAGERGLNVVATDSVRNEIRTTHDTLLMRDTLLLHEYTRGDTVFRDRTETRWRERVAQRTDTVFLERVVQVAPATTHKPNRGGWFLAGACAALLLLGVVGIVVRRVI